MNGRSYKYAGDVDFGSGVAGRVEYHEYTRGFGRHDEETEIRIFSAYGQPIAHYNAKGMLNAREVLENAQKYVFEKQAPRGDLAVGRRFEITDRSMPKKQQGTFEIIDMDSGRNRDRVEAVRVLPSGKISRGEKSWKYVISFYDKQVAGRLVSSTARGKKVETKRVECGDPPAGQSFDSMSAILRAAKTGDVLCFKVAGRRTLLKYDVATPWRDVTGKGAQTFSVGITNAQLRTRGSGGSVFIRTPNYVGLWAGQNRTETIVGVSTTRELAKPAPKKRDYSKGGTITIPRKSKLFRAVLDNMTSARESYIEYDGDGRRDRSGEVDVDRLRASILGNKDAYPKMWWSASRSDPHYVWYIHSGHTYNITAPPPDVLQAQLDAPKSKRAPKPAKKKTRVTKVSKPVNTGSYTTYALEYWGSRRRGDMKAQWIASPPRVGSLEAAKLRAKRLPRYVLWRIIAYRGGKRSLQVAKSSHEEVREHFDARDPGQRRLEELEVISEQREVTPFWSRNVEAHRTKVEKTVRRRVKTKPVKRRAKPKRKRALSMIDQIKAAERALRGKR